MKNNNFFELTIKGVVVNDLGQVLVLKRSKSDKNGPKKYDLPGGRLEEGEGIEECFLREIKEELGNKIEIEIDSILYAFDFPKKYEKKIGFDGKEMLVNGKGLRFLAYYKSGEIKLSDEHEKFEWLEMDKAIEKFNDDDFERDKKESVKKAKELIELKKSLSGWKRAIADFENYKERQAENSKDIIFYANLNLILEILPILDNFHSATKHIPEKQENEAWVTGIMYIQKQLEKVLQDNGLLQIEVKKGDEFDPQIHEAIEDKKSVENEKNDITKATFEGKIKEVLSRGYKMKERVVRPARVIVE